MLDSQTREFWGSLAYEHQTFPLTFHYAADNQPIKHVMFCVHSSVGGRRGLFVCEHYSFARLVTCIHGIFNAHKWPRCLTLNDWPLCVCVYMPLSPRWGFFVSLSKI